MNASLDLPKLDLTIPAAELKRLLKTIAPVAKGEALAKVGPDGLRFELVTPDNTAMLVLDAPRRLFAEYSAEPGRVVFDLFKLGEVLKIARAGGTILVRLEVDPTAERLPIRATVLKEGLAPVVRSMCAIDPASVLEPKVPTHAQTERADGIDPEALAGAVKEAARVSDHLALHRSKGGVMVRAESEASGPIETELSAGTITGAGRSVYPLDMLGPVGAAVAKAERVSLIWGRDAVLTVDFDMGAGLAGKYLIAPRIEEEGAGFDERHTPADWYAWSMRYAEPAAEPDYSAAGIADTPDDVVTAEVARVAALNAAEIAQYEVALAGYQAAMSGRAAILARYEAERAEACDRWRALHPKSKKDPPKRWMPTRPEGPREPAAPLVHTLFPPAHAWERRGVPDRKRRAELRGHPGAGVSWAPKPPAPADPPEPAAFETAPMCEFEAPAEPAAPEPADGPEAWVAERTEALEAAGDPDGVLAETADPEPAAEAERPGLCRHGDHPTDGTYAYSDGSGHPCCRGCDAEFRGISHGPGRFVPLGGEAAEEPAPAPKRRRRTRAAAAPDRSEAEVAALVSGAAGVAPPAEPEAAGDPEPVPEPEPEAPAPELPAPIEAAPTETLTVETGGRTLGGEEAQRFLASILGGVAYVGPRSYGVTLPPVPPDAPEPAGRPEMTRGWRGWRKRWVRAPKPRRASLPAPPAAIPEPPTADPGVSASWRAWRTAPRFRLAPRCAGRGSSAPRANVAGRGFYR